MRIVINHLTRMQPGYFCAAGVEVKSGLHVRPIQYGGLTTDLLRREGGPFELGATLELGPTQFIGQAPEIEDRVFDRANLQVAQQPDANLLFDLCASIAKPSLQAIFSSELKSTGATMAMHERRGMYSLGCCWVEKASLEITHSFDLQRLRLRWVEQGHAIAVAVSDIRFYEPDHRMLITDFVRQVQQWLRENGRVLLSVGLSRPYRKSEDETPMHWLQVNNIHYGF